MKMYRAIQQLVSVLFVCGMLVALSWLLVRLASTNSATAKVTIAELLELDPGAGRLVDVDVRKAAKNPVECLRLGYQGTSQDVQLIRLGIKRLGNQEVHLIALKGEETAGELADLASTGQLTGVVSKNVEFGDADNRKIKWLYPGWQPENNLLLEVGRDGFSVLMLIYALALAAIIFFVCKRLRRMRVRRKKDQNWKRKLVNELQTPRIAPVPVEPALINHHFRVPCLAEPETSRLKELLAQNIPPAFGILLAIVSPIVVRDPTWPLVLLLIVGFGAAMYSTWRTTGLAIAWAPLKFLRRCERLSSDPIPSFANSDFHAYHREMALISGMSSNGFFEAGKKAGVEIFLSADNSMVLMVPEDCQVSIWSLCDDGVVIETKRATYKDFGTADLPALQSSIKWQSEQLTSYCEKNTVKVVSITPANLEAMIRYVQIKAKLAEQDVYREQSSAESNRTWLVPNWKWNFALGPRASAR